MKPMRFSRNEWFALAAVVMLLALCVAFYTLSLSHTLRLVPSIYDRPPPEPTPAPSSHCETVPGPQLIIYCTTS
jgi:hypothetical protein